MATGKKILYIVLLVIAVSALPAQDLESLKSARPVSITGNIGLNTSFYHMSEPTIPVRQTPFAYGVNANATLSVYGISMPFSFTWYSNEKAGFRQPFNQFGISPTYKWLTVHLGYRNLSFSEFTLNGHTFLGAGVEARPGKFRLGAMYGKFNQYSDYNLAVADSIPRMTRSGWAWKAGYGTDSRFVDISMLRIGDNPKNFVDSLAKLNYPTPAQNVVFGLTSKFSITPELLFHFDGSVSVFTANRKIETPDSTAQGMLRFADNFITVNHTSGAYKAIKTGLSYRFAPNIASGIEYRRIDPHFQSMGSYFFNNDMELVTLNQTVALLENKINLRGSLGLQHDNLDGAKKNTSHRVVGSLNGGYTPNQSWAFDASYSNFSTNQRAFKTAGSDSLKIYQVNHNLSFTPRFMKMTEAYSHMVMLNLNLMKLDDKNKLTEEQTDTDTRIAMLMYNLGLQRLRLNITTGLNYTEMTNKNFRNRLTGVTMNVAKSFLDDKLSLNWNSAILANNMNDTKGTILNTALNANYHFLSRHALQVNINVINNSYGESSTIPSFNEIRGDIGYVFSF
ncbi:hypothetical protein [Proteiniphilum sp.]|uniref:hypothetical protein n=1 Tax=Proteiniphilum sp. TaxID=1926877 RepID=UPI002B21F5D4|nr:hypothetical protein [Proteiniphilum sp.]MEA4918701.1 hypothetical protein [Proteiniphilum sp.]